MSDLLGDAFVEAIEYLRGRLTLSQTDWLQILTAADQRAEEIVDDTADKMRGDLLSALTGIFEAGGTLRDFQDQYEAIARRTGWKGTSPEMAGWHSELIWRMEVFGARAAGRWEQAMKLHREAPQMGYCFRYVTAGDDRVRHNHAQWHGVILPVDHPFWLTHFPPNGFNCRCLPQIVSRVTLARYKWTITPDDDKRLRIPPDAGFDNNVGMAWAKLQAT
ncbi:phage minor head protein [Devosia sp. MC521]|uniref:phage head morphogenesis protein n=1 Tax=Devosia sp. MC521 TaxID=2759954 RepID=UPI0015F96735|nr:phage minor head protein [Devosia sp. MC521]MBJ6985918.1 minor capsid protein [Devosia sp. MC521]QMW61295.1 minor capsid protein [Devosia sp. MC521]